MRIRENLLISKVCFFAFMFLLIIIFTSVFSEYIKSILSSILTILTIFISTTAAFVIYFGNQRDTHNGKVNEQIKIIEGLLAELDVLERDNQEIYGGEVIKGNISWYKEIIDNTEKNYLNILDHKINSIHIETYIAKLDSNLCSRLEIRKLIRHLSNVNDKISQLNYYVFEKKKLKYRKNCLNIINEVLPKIKILREVLNSQKQNLQGLIFA